MMRVLPGLSAAFRRELRAYFATPLAYVFIAVFLFLLGFLTWEASRFFETAAADLAPFFFWHPWLFMIFLPALSMRLWADERANGTLELQLAMPVSLTGLVIGKWLAAWAVAALSLALTFPMWVTVNYLGPADNAAIIATYLTSLMMAGAYLAIGAAVSALSSSQVLAYVVSVTIAFFFTAAGWPMVVGAVSDMTSPAIGEAVASFSFLTQFETAQRGVLELRAGLYLTGFIAVCMALNTLFVSYRRSAS